MLRDNKLQKIKSGLSPKTIYDCYSGFLTSIYILSIFIVVPATETHHSKIDLLLSRFMRYSDTVWRHTDGKTNNGALQLSTLLDVFKGLTYTNEEANET